LQIAEFAQYAERFDHSEGELIQGCDKREAGGDAASQLLSFARKNSLLFPWVISWDRFDRNP